MASPSLEELYQVGYLADLAYENNSITGSVKFGYTHFAQSNNDLNGFAGSGFYSPSTNKMVIAYAGTGTSTLLGCGLNCTTA